MNTSAAVGKPSVTGITNAINGPNKPDITNKNVLVTRRELELKRTYIWAKVMKWHGFNKKIIFLEFIFKLI
eukprot:CAMPEP_0115004878 /NCGR_PEP_ID=MMETSP0216-20121206/19518_1 /TAXON_ID=223996 /ORGANISM="Protocruzia adherens, Strain Boccale" /LENGTH=70 /DNA_ID=CAMNT_0002371057 /DNA_START=511 /DNA_END=723 /DNA_ORIENTATION=-